MKRHLFLTGPAFCGKSYLIREKLGKRLQAAGGFCTELSTDDSGALLGCSMLPAAMAGGAEGYEKVLFLDMRRFPPSHDSEVFRGLGVRLLDEAAWYPFAVLDEIGGIDLIIPQFRMGLDSLLASDLPILGVVKTREEAELMRESLGPGERFRAFSERLHEQLENDPNTEILTVQTDPQQEAKDAVTAWIAEYAALPGFV